MTLTTDYTAEARGAVGPFVERAGKTFLVVRCGDVFGDERVIRVTPDDVAEFFATQARNLSSGCRTLAGLTATGVPSRNWPKSASTGSRV